MKPFSILIAAIAAIALLAGCLPAQGQSFFKSKKLSPSHTYTFESLPQNLDELQALPEADLKDPYAVAALTLAALTRYRDNIDDCLEMLDWLKGPESLSSNEILFLRERLRGKEYKPFSFFKGATPDNNYTPSKPYKVTIQSNQYTFQTDGSGKEWAAMLVTSGGADNPRYIKLRQKKSTGQWFLNDIQCLSDIRIPAEEDPWN